MGCGRLDNMNNAFITRPSLSEMVFVFLKLEVKKILLHVKNI